MATFAILGPTLASPAGTPSDPITWAFGSPSANPGAGFSDAITDPAQQAQAEAAIQTWATETGLNFKQVPDTPAANPEIIIGYGDFGSDQTGILGQTNYSWSGPIGGKETFNPGSIVRVEDPAETPLTVASDGSMWYQGVVSISLKQDVMHEFGHALGLASNPTDHAAVMYDGLGASNQTLDANDVAAIASLYPYVTPPGTDTLLSSGGAADKLDIAVSEDAWKGDAQFTVSVDGKQVGGVQTAHALHASGADEIVELTGQWGTGAHAVEISFINDAWGGTAATDRNLYVNGIAYDGNQYANTSASFWTNGSKSFTVGASAPAMPTTSPQLTLHLSEDAWKGDAQFQLSVDGKTITTPQAVTALHSSRNAEDFVFGGLSSGTHDIGVTFLNDAYGGTPATDRNLYVNSVDFGSNHYATNATLLSNGTVHFTVSSG